MLSCVRKADDPSYERVVVAMSAAVGLRDQFVEAMRGMSIPVGGNIEAKRPQAWRGHRYK